MKKPSFSVGLLALACVTGQPLAAPNIARDERTQQVLTACGYVIFTEDFEDYVYDADRSLINQTDSLFKAHLKRNYSKTDARKIFLNGASHYINLNTEKLLRDKRKAVSDCREVLQLILEQLKAQS
jgi:hypothetical protein